MRKPGIKGIQEPPSLPSFSAGKWGDGCRIEG